MTVIFLDYTDTYASFRQLWILCWGERKKGKKDEGFWDCKKCFKLPRESSCSILWDLWVEKPESIILGITQLIPPSNKYLESSGSTELHWTKEPRYHLSRLRMHSRGRAVNVTDDLRYTGITLQGFADSILASDVCLSLGSQSAQESGQARPWILSSL